MEPIGDRVSSIWNTERENRIKRIGDKAAAFVWLYNSTADFYQFWSKFINIFIASCTYILGPGGIITILVVPQDDIVLKWIIFSIGVLTILVGVVATILTILKLDKKIGRSRHSSAKNANIFKEIKAELALARDDRQSYDKFYKKILDQEIKLQTEAPDIPSYIFNKYQSTFYTRAFTKGELYQEPMTILIESPGDSVESIREPMPVRNSMHVALDLSKLPGNKIQVVEPNSTRPRENLKHKLSSKQVFELEKYFCD
jgi:hypothetical protein